jgi:hypothetical protein
LLPEKIKLDGCTTADATLTSCRANKYSAVLIDHAFPAVDALVNQLRVLQPDALFVCLALRTIHGAENTAAQGGYDGVLFKPFDKNSVSDFIARHLSSGPSLVTVAGDVISMAPFAGGRAGMMRHFRKVYEQAQKAFDQVADSCYEVAILNIAPVPDSFEHLPRLVVDLDQHARRLGLRLPLVGEESVKGILKQVLDTSDMPYFASEEQARVAADAGGGGRDAQR